MHTSVNRAGCRERRATDVMTTWRTTAPSIIHTSPGDGNGVCTAEVDALGVSRAAYNPFTGL